MSIDRQAFDDLAVDADRPDQGGLGARPLAIAFDHGEHAAGVAAPVAAGEVGLGSGADMRES